MGVRTSEELAAALAQRLTAATDAYLGPAGLAAVDDALRARPVDDDSSLARAGALLDAMVRRVAQTSDTAGAWLLWTAVHGAFPTADEVRETRRTIELLDPAGAATWLLRRALGHPRSTPSMHLPMDVLVDTVVASVDYCARVEHHTGIQRVVRETLPRWDGEHTVHPVAWTDEGTVMRDLDEVETDRVLRWNAQVHVGREQDPEREPRLQVPWRSNVVLVEVPLPQMTPALQALAEYSGNEVTAVGYDAIPVVSADVRPYTEADNYVQYLSILKHARRISGISVSAAQEFRGFADALHGQGLRPPVVTEAFLPGEAPHATAEPPEGTRPLVLSVGSQELHKNHLALLYAAEVLWREGLDFELQLLGRAGWLAERLEERVATLAAQGRPVGFRRGVFDAELWATYRRARCTVFPSLHEGYGLPVAESLACGTPVITTDYGSTREIAEAGGGCLLVDPRDEEAVVLALRRLLTDDDLWHRLRAEAKARPVRRWADYAAELWEQLVAPGPGGRS